MLAIIPRVFGLSDPKIAKTRGTIAKLQKLKKQKSNFCIFCNSSSSFVKIAKSAILDFALFAYFAIIPRVFGLSDPELQKLEDSLQKLQNPQY